MIKINIIHILLYILPAIIALMGAIGGVILGRDLQARSWKNEYLINIKKEIAYQRIKLIERMSYILNKSGRVTIINQMIDNQRMFLEIIKEEGTKCEDIFDKFLKIESLIELNKEIFDISAEFNALVNLCGIYFGEKTRESLKNIQKMDEKWHAMTLQDKQDILDNMVKESNDYAFLNKSS